MCEELNKKLAEWAWGAITRDGFIIKVHDEIAPNQVCLGYEEEVICKVEELNFTQSLDACFKRLVSAWNIKDRPIPTWIENIIFCFMAGNLVRRCLGRRRNSSPSPMPSNQGISCWYSRWRGPSGDEKLKC